jgi:CheY-like chemotaxis protein
MVIESDEEMRARITEKLASSGYRVMKEPDSCQAIEDARETAPDLLIVDMDMPVDYELVAARFILKRAGLPRVPVVVVAARDEENVPTLGETVFRNEFVTSVGELDEVGRLVEHLLPNRPVVA